MELYTLHLFAGAGGGILGDLLLRHTPIGAVEIEAYPRKVLLQRQLDGILPRFPIWDDVCTFRKDNPDCQDYINRLITIRGKLCICGGFPCQDVSCAGKGAGIEGERSGLWKEYARIISEIRPAYAFVENSPMLVSRGLGRVLADLAAMGYDARWGVFSAADAGARHLRERIWVLASHAMHKRLEGCVRRAEFGLQQMDKLASLHSFPQNENDLPTPVLLGSGHGMANYVDRIRAIGNGQVPACVAMAWKILNPENDG